MGCSQSGSSVHGILQATILEWIAISFPGDVSDPGIKSRSPAMQVDSLPLSHQVSPLSLISTTKYLFAFLFAHTELHSQVWDLGWVMWRPDPVECVNQVPAWAFLIQMASASRHHNSKKPCSFFHPQLRRNTLHLRCELLPVHLKGEE